MDTRILIPPTSDMGQFAKAAERLETRVQSDNLPLVFRALFSLASMGEQRQLITTMTQVILNEIQEASSLRLFRLNLTMSEQVMLIKTMLEKSSALSSSK